MDENAIREAILKSIREADGKDEYVWVTVTEDTQGQSGYAHAGIKTPIDCAIPKVIADWRYLGAYMPQKDGVVTFGPGGDWTCDVYVDIKSFDECTNDQQTKINQKMAQLKRTAENNQGKITQGKMKIPLYPFGVNDPKRKGTIEIPITLEELLNAGIAPEDVYWEALEQKQEQGNSAKITTAERADATRGVSEGKVGEAKGLFARLLDKVKGKGEGEK